MTDPYENLANAIVLQAVKDYRDALKRLKKKPGNQAACRVQWSVNASSAPAGTKH